MKRGKDKPTSDLFTALGVNFDLARAILSDDPQIVVKNKESRIEEICLSIHDHLQRGEMIPAEATELRGKIIFSNSQTYGKMGALAYYQFGLKAKETGSIARISKELRWALLWWTEHIAKYKARIIRTGPQREPVYLFTDGSCGPDESSPLGIKAAYGAVMYDPEDQSLETFGQDIGEDLLRLLSSNGDKRQVVGQSELIPCHAAQVIWKDQLKDRRVVTYIDNEAARYGLIEGTSPTRDSAWLIQEFWTAEAKNESNSWIERVPSASNCADGPSRGKFQILKTTTLQARKIQMPTSYEQDLVDQWETEHGT